MNILSKLMNTGISVYKTNKPLVYASAAVTSNIVAGILLIKETKVVMEVSKEMKAEESKIDDPKILKQRKFKRYLRVLGIYAPAIIAETTSILSIITSYKVSITRTAAFATAYALTRDDYSLYRSKVKEVVGAKKEETIAREASASVVNKNPVPKDDEILSTGEGNTLFYDKIGGRYFRSSIDAVRTAEKQVTDWIHAYDSASVNDLYGQLYLEDTVAGSVLGWNSKNPLNIKLNSTRLSDNGEAAIVLEYDWMPLYAYDQVTY